MKQREQPVVVLHPLELETPLAAPAPILQHGTLTPHGIAQPERMANILWTERIGNYMHRP